MSQGEGSETPPKCRRDGCNNPMLRKRHGNARPAYCCEECAYAAQLVRQRAKRAAARGKAPPTPTMCRGCGSPTTQPARGVRVWCSDRCRYAARNRRALDDCQRPGCGAPLPKGRGRYCSDECRLVVTAARQRIERRKGYEPPPCPDCGRPLQRHGVDLGCLARCGYYLPGGAMRLLTPPTSKAQ